MKDFEVIGYMKAKLPGEDDFGMFVNENTYGSSGGYEWKFLDFVPEDIYDHRRIFVHLQSLDEIKRSVSHEEFMGTDKRPDFRWAVERVLESCSPGDDQMQLTAVHSLMRKIVNDEDYAVLESIEKQLEDRIYGEDK